MSNFLKANICILPIAPILVFFNTSRRPLYESTTAVSVLGLISWALPISDFAFISLFRPSSCIAQHACCRFASARGTPAMIGVYYRSIRPYILVRDYILGLFDSNSNCKRTLLDSARDSGFYFSANYLILPQSFYAIRLPLVNANIWHPDISLYQRFGYFGTEVLSEHQ